jgi:hypothetical protein
LLAPGEFYGHDHAEEWYVSVTREVGIGLCRHALQDQEQLMGGAPLPRPRGEHRSRFLRVGSEQYLEHPPRLRLDGDELAHAATFGQDVLEAPTLVLLPVQAEQL